MKLAKNAADLDDWEANNAETIAGLNMDEAQTLRDRVDWWKANKLPRVAP
jgi:hypothetical protein